MDNIKHNTFSKSCEEMVGKAPKDKKDYLFIMHLFLRRIKSKLKRTIHYYLLCKLQKKHWCSIYIKKHDLHVCNLCKEVFKLKDTTK